jgi:hypothetical protein
MHGQMIITSKVLVRKPRRNRHVWRLFVDGVTTLKLGFERYVARMWTGFTREENN